MPKKSVSVEQGQLLRAAESDQCLLEVKAKPIPETLTQRQRDVLELTRLLPVSWYSACVYGKDADDRIGDDRTRSWKTHQVIALKCR